MKQNRYPVLLLTQGANSKYDDYLDPRTWTIQNASHFVAMAEILGVNAMAECVQRDAGLVQMMKERNQVIFVWTVIHSYAHIFATFFKISIFETFRMIKMTREPSSISKNWAWTALFMTEWMSITAKTSRKAFSFVPKRRK